MKIMIVSSTFPEEKPGGVPTYVEGRSLHLARKMSVSTSALGNSRRCYHDLGDLTTRMYLGSSASFKYLFIIVWLKLIRNIIMVKPDVLEIHNIPVGLPLFFVSPLLGVPKMRYFFHGPSRLEAQIEGKSRLNVFMRYWLEKLCLHRCDKIMCASRNFRSLLLKEHPELTRKGVPVGVYYPRILRQSVKDEERQFQTADEVRLFCIRRLVERTGTLQLVNAFIDASLKGKMEKNIILQIAGTGPLKNELKLMIADAGLEDRIRMLGYVTEEEKIQHFLESDYNVVPTMGLEGFGLVVVEAAFYGCPSIVTDVCALPEVLGKLNGIGQVVSPTHEGIMSALIEQRRYTPEDKRNLREIAIKRFGV